MQNVVNTRENSSSNEEVCALSVQSHSDLNYALHPKPPNVIGSSSAQDWEKLVLCSTCNTHHELCTIFRAEITKSDVATWYADFSVTKHMTNGLDWFTCLKLISKGLWPVVVTNDRKLWVRG
jgi:hypothetical protein